MGMMDERSTNGDRNGVVNPPSMIEFHTDEELMRQLAAGAAGGSSVRSTLAMPH